MLIKNKIGKSLLVLSAVIFSVVSYADITGSVFQDFNANDNFDVAVSPGTQAVDRGVAAVTVTAYDASGLSVGTTTSCGTDVGVPGAWCTGNNVGFYNLAVTGAGPFRVEFTALPEFFKTGVSSAGETSAVQFVADQNATNVDYSINIPFEYCQNNPDMVMTCFVGGDAVNGANNANEVLIDFQYLAGNTSGTLVNGPGGHDDTGYGVLVHPTAIPANQMGAINGMGFQKSTETVFAASYLRSFASFGPTNSTGTIYQVTGANTASVFADLNVLFPMNPAGDNPHPNGTFNFDNNSDEGISGPLVGKLSLGDIDVTADDESLLVVNLFDRNLYRIPIADTSATVRTPIPLQTGPGLCPSADDIRPFAIAIKNDTAYVGLVCSAESTQVTADMMAHIYEYDVNNDTFAASPAFSFPLNYARGCANGSPTFPVNGNCSANSLAAWRPWQDNPATTPSFPQPMLTDIVFDGEDLIIGFRDRYADQSTGFIRSAGDILRACDDGSGSWTLESNGQCGLISSTGADNGQGPGVGPGPATGFGEYYFADRFSSFHGELGMGSLAQIPGYPDVVMSLFDPIFQNQGGTTFDGGVRWLRNSVTDAAGGPGDFVRIYRLYNDSGDFGPGDPFFGKANGLGDVEALCSAAPVEIGNRVWCDSGSGVAASDGNGIQDPGETLAPGVTVRLTCGAEFAETSTDAAGHYLFTDIIWEADDGTLSTLIPRDTACTVSIDTSLASNATALNNACGLITPTIANVLTALDNDDVRDSDGILNGSVLEAIVNTSGANTTGVAGENDHTIDFGFGANTDFGDNPDPAYSTLLASNGAVHTVSPGLFLGACVDTEVDGQPNATASGDDAAVGFSTLGTCAVAGDDEDGVSDLQNLFVGNATASVDVTSTGACELDAWIDFNQNGDFTDAGEQIFTSQTLVAGLNDDLNFAIPAGATAGDTFSRFRCSSTGGLSPTGAAPDGEVEDYPVTILPDLSLGDFVWYDINQNGQQDGGEPGVNGINVDLYPNATCTGQPIDFTTTSNGGVPAADGFYEFTQLLAGSYCVEFTNLPTDYEFTGQNIGNDVTDSDANPTNGQVQNINLAADDPTIDAGVFLNGSIAGLTWCESTTNANTAYNPGDGDSVLPNVGITLYEDANCNNVVDGTDAGTAVNQDTNNPAGTYLFDNLPVGPVGSAVCYVVEVDDTDIDLGVCDSGITPVTQGPDLDTVTPDVTDVNFGFEQNLTLGDFVWYDTNQNGQQDGGEPGVNGINVDLYPNATCAGQPIDFTTTNTGGVPAADGFYQFTGLNVGTYCVEFSGLPVNYQFTDQNIGNDVTDSDANPANGQVQNINLAADDPTIDAGVFLNGSIAGLTWCESSTNSNTTYNPGDGDTVLPNIGVTLYEDANCNDAVDGGDASTAVTQDTNNPAGTYLFDNLPVGPVGSAICYVVEVDETDADLGACDTGITPITQGPDLDTVTPDVTDVNFGFDDNLGLGDFVWFDTNQNGQQDGGEPGVNGIAVNLYDNATCTAPAVDSTTTANGGTPAADGYYFFGDLDPGDYCVEFTGLPTNYQFTDQNIGNDATDSDADTTNGQVLNITITDVDLTIDAGVFLNGSIAGLTWCESSTNSNTAYNPGDGDTVLTDITVTLYEDANCNDAVDGGDAATAVSQDTTNPGGTYLFDNLPVGPVGSAVCYVVEVDDTDTDLGVCDSGITPVTQGPDLDTVTPDVTDVNFGFDDLLSLGDYVLYDNNQNGQQDIDEVGVNGITVNLYDNATCTAPSVDSTTTASGGSPAVDGYYNFASLDPGSYCVEFIGLPVDYVFTVQNQGDDATDSDADPVTGQVLNINLTATDETIDAGIYASNGQVSGLLYCDDSPENGSQDAGEEVAGVQVTLSRDLDCDNNGDEVIGNMDTDGTGSFLFDNLPVGLAPAPPNPQACYVLEYDTQDPLLAGCNRSVTPETQVVTIDTNTPEATPVTFIVVNGVNPPPTQVPVNSWLTLMLMVVSMLVIFWRQKRISQ